VRWGTELHDRFMLPHFVEQDFADVLEEQRNAGFRSTSSGSRRTSSSASRRSATSRRQRRGRRAAQALEPWHVMGEEGSPGGTVRYVDSSVERMQVKATGMATRSLRAHLQRPRLPLRPPAMCRRVRGRRALPRLAAAVSLHPDDRRAYAADGSTSSIPGWKRSLGGCQYHVAHPGGRSYATFR
jgi:uncharacterized protein (DUF2126 family)